MVIAWTDLEENIEDERIGLNIISFGDFDNIGDGIW